MCYCVYTGLSRNDKPHLIISCWSDEKSRLSFSQKYTYLFVKLRFSKLQKYLVTFSPSANRFNFDLTAISSTSLALSVGLTACVVALSASLTACVVALSTVLAACVAGSVYKSHYLCCWFVCRSHCLCCGSVYSPHCLCCGLCPQVSVLGGCDCMIYCQCVIFIIIIIIIINCFVCVFFAGRPPCRPVLLAGRCLQLFGPYWLLPSPVLLLAVHGLCARAGLHHELPCGALLQPHPQVV